MKNKYEEDLLFICDCGDPEDQIIMRFWSDELEEEDYPAVYVTYHLNKYRFWKRLWHGIKYIFGYTTKWGDFGEIVLDPSDHEKLLRVYEYLKRAHDKRKGTKEYVLNGAATTCTTSSGRTDVTQAKPEYEFPTADTAVDTEEEEEVSVFSEDEENDLVIVNGENKKEEEPEEEEKKGFKVKTTAKPRLNQRPL